MSFEMNMLHDVIADVAKQQENLLLEQLNDLVSRGLLVVESGPISLIEEADQMFRPNETRRVRLVQTIKLRLKDREYIEQLEKENQEMRLLLDRVRSGVLGRN